MVEPKVEWMPKRLYAKRQVDRATGHVVFVVAESLLEMTEGWEEGDRVGYYELKETGTLHVTRELK